jgi:hypothetical protein
LRWKGGVFQAAEKPFHAVILSLLASLRVNFTKDSGSSLGWAIRVNYRGSSPKERAQNDRAFEFFRSL